MASPHSKEFSPCQRRPLVIPAFPDDADSHTASTLAPPWSLSAADFMDVQLQELARLNGRLNQLNQSFNPFIEACLAGIIPIDALTAVCLVRLRGEVQELTGHTEQVTASHYQRWTQVRRRQSEER
ncbi:MAG TPA: hypothetical protein VES89_09790 [Candidatus Competibacteraceae bacterium]|jgi:hypothetical protein|nr:hypothetical protein [Candidatus Competibacteraceae bacterium]